MINYIWIGIILEKLGMLHGWTLFWFIVCLTMSSLKWLLGIANYGEK